MNFDIDALAKLLAEQNTKKAEFDGHLQFDFLGMDNPSDQITERYQELKALAKRIIQIENMLDLWAQVTYLPLEGYAERAILN